MIVIGRAGKSCACVADAQHNNIAATEHEIFMERPSR
jgi:hypothetical protein